MITKQNELNSIKERDKTRIMKVLLVNIPWVNNSEYYGLRAGSRWPHLRMKKEQLSYYPFPFFLAYACSLLKKNGFDARVLDCIAEEMSQDEFFVYLEKFQPDLVLSETSTPSIYNDLSLTKKIKEKTGCFTVLCGQHATALPEEVLANWFVDYVLIGEYEEVLLNLARRLENGDDVSDLKGLAFRQKGMPVVNPREELIKDLDLLSYPERESLPMRKYNDPFCKHAPNVQMISSRGCPYKCIFCLEPHVWYGKPNYRMRSPGAVVDEIEYLVKKYSAREIYFDDSSFSVNQERVIKICDEILNRNLKVAWSCMADAKLLEKTLIKMKKAGCVAVKFGVESADPEILRNINKHINLEDVQRVVRLCRKIGIESHATYVLGLPGETKETMGKTIDFAFSLGTDTAQFSAALPFPGTEFYRMAKQNNWLTTNDYSKYNGCYDSIIRYPGVDNNEIIQALHRCRKRVMIKTVLNPAKAYKYMVMIWRYGGIQGMCRTAVEKLGYLLRS